MRSRFLVQGAAGRRAAFRSPKTFWRLISAPLDRATPTHVKAALVGALAYFVLPFDGIPDVLPFLGYTDDAAILATAIKLVAGHIRPEHRNAAREALARGLGDGP